MLGSEPGRKNDFVAHCQATLFLIQSFSELLLRQIDRNSFLVGLAQVDAQHKKRLHIMRPGGIINTHLAELAGKFPEVVKFLSPSMIRKLHFPGKGKVCIEQ
jgi:hypothetical protein